jgi:hypothetical protein
MGEPSDEDDDSFEGKHNPRMPKSFLLENRTMNGKGLNHPWLEMLVGFLPVYGMYLRAMVVVTSLHEVVVATS